MSNLPFVSVIMPVCNEAGSIAYSLASILRQDYPPGRMEVLVIDGMPDDKTREIIQQTSAGCHHTIKILDNPDRITPTALNVGLQNAQGEIILRIDGHCRIMPDYIRRCVEGLQKTRADCVGGAMTTTGKTRMAKTIAFAQSSRFGVGNVAFRTGRKRAGYVDTVPFGAYRREVFERIGKFDEELVRNQDDEFNFRLIQSGGKIWFDPSIRSIYHSRSALRGLWQQYFQYGFYKVRVIQKRGAVPSWRHPAPAAFVLTLLAGALLAIFSHQPLWILSVLGIYFITAIVFSLLAARSNWRVMPLLPISFLCLHLAYGTGFLWGLWRWNKEKIITLPKTAIYFIFSLICLYLTMPLFAIISLLIKLDSPGPIIFKQKRVGKNGRVFTLLKFRTMRLSDGAAITSSADKRITKIGKFLRKTKLDEMPQFINVLKEDMSIVGPRPEIPEMVELYTTEQRKVLAFKPGITSLAALKFRNEEEIIENSDSASVKKFYLKEIMPLKIECDLNYFNNSHFRSDFWIIFKTAGEILNVRNKRIEKPFLNQNLKRKRDWLKGLFGRI